MKFQGDKIKLVSSTVFVHKKWFKNLDKFNFYEVKYLFFINNYIDEDWKILKKKKKR
jgi:hypothetical protein